MPKYWKEIITISIRNRSAVWIDNGWNADIDDMMRYIEEKYKEWWGNLPRNELIRKDRAINIILQLCTMAETKFEKISKELDKEYGVSKYVKN